MAKTVGEILDILEIPMMSAFYKSTIQKMQPLQLVRRLQEANVSAEGDMSELRGRLLRLEAKKLYPNLNVPWYEEDKFTPAETLCSKPMLSGVSSSCNSAGNQKNRDLVEECLNAIRGQQYELRKLNNRLSRYIAVQNRKNEENVPTPRKILDPEILVTLRDVETNPWNNGLWPLGDWDLDNDFEDDSNLHYDYILERYPARFLHEIRQVSDSNNDESDNPPPKPNSDVDTFERVDYWDSSDSDSSTTTY